jgi:hypothetical protein
MDKLDDLKKKYSVELNAPLLTNYLNQTTSWCRLNPIGCLQQVLIETLFILTAYSSVIFLVGGQLPKVIDILKFFVVFVLFSVAARMVSDTFSDKLSVAAISGLGIKLAATMVPRLSSW